MASKVILNADASQFVSELGKAKKSVNDTAASAEQARQRITSSFKLQIDAAKQVGASQRELESITRRTAEMMASVTDTNAKRIVSSLDRISERRSRVAKELADLRNLVPPETSHDYTPSRQSQASASIRALGGTPSIRAAENFASSIPFLAGAFEKAFPIIGAAALTAEVLRGVDALAKMKKEADELPAHIKDGFDAINSPIVLEADNLRKTNAELEISIAHLEHKPANTLALALAEARINADNLAASAQKAYADVKKLLEENQAGFFAQIFSGQGATGAVSGEIEKRSRELRDLQRSQRDAVRSGQSTTAIDAQIASRRDDFRKYISGTRRTLTGNETVADLESGNRDATKTVSYAQAHGKQDANLDALAGAEDILDNQDDLANQQRQNTADQKRLKSLQDRQKLSQESLEASRKAQEAQREEWETEIKDLQSTGALTISAEHQFWIDRENSVVDGSKNYIFAEQKASESLKKINEEQKKLFDERLKWNLAVSQETFSSVSKAIGFGLPAEGKGISDAQSTGVTLRDTQRAAAFAIGEANVQLAQQQGRISASDAALQLQTLHLLQYNEQLAELKEQLAAVQVGPEAPAQRNRINTQIAELDGRRAVEAMRDNAAVAAQTWQDALEGANAQWVQNSQDSARQVVELYQRSLSGLNQNVSSLITGGGSNFTGLFRGIGQNIANIGLQRIEAPLLGSLGLAKADGSGSNPFHVVVDNLNLVGGSSANPFSDLRNIFSSSSDDDGNGLGSFAGKAAGIVAGSIIPGGSFLSGIFGGGRAIGGGVDAGSTYLVGERGPELLSMGRSSGNITPNHKLGGNTAYYNVTVADGVTPEQFDMKMNSALRQFHPQVVKSSLEAMDQRANRSPVRR